MPRTVAAGRTAATATRDWVYKTYAEYEPVNRPVGGARALARCVGGFAGVHARIVRPAPYAPIQAVSFSVLPRLTALWAACLRGSHPDLDIGVVVGDCSGGFRGPAAAGLTVVPYPNATHGAKVDAFFDRLLRAPVTLVSDDDIFFAAPGPLRFALDQLHDDPEVPVVSLVPRARFTWKLDGREHVPMGSYCLVVRRSVWDAEGLRFRPRPEPSPSAESYKGLYDTADKANVELIRRGRRVVIAGEQERAGLVVCKGVSSNVLRLRKGRDDDPERLLEIYELATALDALYERALGHDLAPIIDPRTHAHVDAAVAPQVDHDLRDGYRADARDIVTRVEAALATA